jgi:methionine sulfoxide reductase heme-binding subunit
MMEISTWSLIRSSGIVAYLLLSLSVAAGLYVSIRKRSGGKGAMWSFFHIAVGNWALYLSIFHGILVSYDTYVGFQWRELLIPFASHYKTIGMAMGTLGLYALFVTVFTSEFRQAIGISRWQKLHRVNPLLYIMVTFHGILTGTDTDTSWGLYMYLSSALVIMILLYFRFRTLSSSSYSREV